MAGCHREASHSAASLLSKLLNVFFPIASLMGQDNGSSTLSAHAGDASAFVQPTCVVGTWPLGPEPGPLQPRPLVQRPFALEATRGSAHGNVAPAPCWQGGWPAGEALLKGWVIQARLLGPGPLMDKPGQLFMASSCCFFGGAGSKLPTAGCSAAGMLNCG